MEAQHIVNLRLGAEAEEDFVAKDQRAFERDEITRHAVVLGAHALIREHRQFGSAERLLARVIQLRCALREHGGLLFETTTQDLVVALVDVFGSHVIGRHDNLLGLGKQKRCEQTSEPPEIAGFPRGKERLARGGS